MKGNVLGMGPLRLRSANMLVGGVLLLLFLGVAIAVSMYGGASSPSAVVLVAYGLFGGGAIAVLRHSRRSRWADPNGRVYPFIRALLLLGTATAAYWIGGDPHFVVLALMPAWLIPFGVAPVLALAAALVPAYLRFSMDYYWLTDRFTEFFGMPFASWGTAIPMMRAFGVIYAVGLALGYATLFACQFPRKPIGPGSPMAIRGHSRGDALVAAGTIGGIVLFTYALSGGLDSWDSIYNDHVRRSVAPLSEQALDVDQPIDRRLDALALLEAKAVLDGDAREEVHDTFRRFAAQCDESGLRSFMTVRAAEWGGETEPLHFEQRPWYMSRNDLAREQFRSTRTSLEQFIHAEDVDGEAAPPANGTAGRLGGGVTTRYG